MIAVLIFFCSVAGVCQFGLHYWRAMIATVAQQTVSDRACVALGVPSGSVRSGDFRAILSLSRMAPALRGQSGGFRAIQAYYLVIESLAARIPMFAGWAEREMMTCSQYAAALLVKRLEVNVACSAEVQNF